MTLESLIAIDIALVSGISILIGASAPRWPPGWLDRDRGPLRLTPYDDPTRYRRLQVGRWARVLPEMGATFGGESKRQLPGTRTSHLQSYLTEVRRAEWVHWLSLLTLVPLAVFNPWWLWLSFAIVVAAVNGPFIAILRHNRLRILSILGKGC